MPWAVDTVVTAPAAEFTFDSICERTMTGDYSQIWDWHSYIIIGLLLIGAYHAWVLRHSIREHYRGSLVVWRYLCIGVLLACFTCTLRNRTQIVRLSRNEREEEQTAPTSGLSNRPEHVVIEIQTGSDEPSTPPLDLQSNEEVFP